MLERYACEYCGMIYKTKSAALKCEEKAKKLKPKFKLGDVVYDLDYSEKFKVLKVFRWRPNFDKIFVHLLEETAMGNGNDASGYYYLGYKHYFAYVLLGLEDDNKTEDFTDKEIFKCGRIRHGIRIGTKGIALKLESDLTVDPPR